MRRAALVVGLALLVGGCSQPAAESPVGTPATAPTTAPTTVPTTVAPRQTTVPATVSPTPKPTKSMSLEETYLLHNEVYSAGRVPAVPCKLPDSPLLDQKDVRLYANAVLVCLDRAWRPVVDRSDVVYEPTKVYVVDDGDRTACGAFDENDADAFYCDGNDGIYLGWKDHVADQDYDKVWAQTYLQFVMAHEFGHHVQQLVGISQYYDERWDRTKGAAQLEQTRRHELQATCFAAAFLGANRETLDLHGERLSAYHDAAYVGDEDDPSSPRDHGSSKSSTYWSDAAFTAKSPSSCNTWAAPAKRVS